MLNLPEKEAKSLSFLSYSLISLAFFNYTKDDFVKIIDLILCIIAFILAGMLYVKNNFDFPLVPCKNRCSTKSNLFCERDKGFIGGIVFSIFLIYFYKRYNIDLSDINKYYFLAIGIFLIMLTIIHGTLRRVYNIATNNEFITFIIGMFTGIGTLFMALFFIMNES